MTSPQKWASDPPPPLLVTLCHFCFPLPPPYVTLCHFLQLKKIHPKEIVNFFFLHLNFSHSSL